MKVPFRFITVAVCITAILIAALKYLTVAIVLPEALPRPGPKVELRPEFPGLRDDYTPQDNGRL